MSDFYTYFKSLDAEVQYAIVSGATAIFTTFLNQLPLIIRYSRKISGESATSEGNDKRRYSQPVKLTRKERRSVLYLKDNLPFLSTDTHPRKFLCPDCLNKNLKQYLKSKKSFYNSGKLSRLICPYCNYQNSFESEQIQLSRLQDDAQNMATST